ncbi:putative aminopeptidase npepl1 [Chamberlinius hualienensis]
MANTVLRFSSKLSPCDPKTHPVIIIGQLKNLIKVGYSGVQVKLETRVTKEDYELALANLHPAPTDSCPLYLNFAHVAALPTKCSRHNTPSRSHAVSKLVKNLNVGIDQSYVIICERSDVYASACAVARSFPLYSRKSGANAGSVKVNVEFIVVEANGEDGLSESDLQCLQNVSYAIRTAAKIVDAPCSEMHVDAFLEEINRVGEELNIVPTVIRGEELEKRGFGGIWNVGKAAERLPALAVLSHMPEGAQQTIAWVGKGIVYDTGGLCIKAKTSMTGMKRDCGGAAGILGAFYAAVKQGFRDNLHAVFCLAENAVGPKATRPDDIITLYSGRTVEINNTDAEGRLVLGDGVVYAHKDLRANIIVDMCTLTGAQGTATGKYHAALVTNNEDWEAASVQAGLKSGDMVHPLPYCPELHFSEFISCIADMKNSVADRGNAQSSCAGLFIAAQIGFDFAGTWIHVDMAALAQCGERATGYGVALLNGMFGHASQSPLLQALSPFSQENGLVEESATKKMRLV